MIPDPDIVFNDDPRRGLVARSGWEQVEARIVLRDLGWEWEEELHGLVPPDDVANADAGVQAVEELHLHGYRTGFAVGPYGIVRLNHDRAEQVFVKLTAPQTAAAPADEDSAPITRNVETADERHPLQSTYNPDSEQPAPEVHYDISPHLTVEAPGHLVNQPRPAPRR